MSRPSTRNLKLPSPPALERLSQSLATLDAILLPEPWCDRYYSFDKNWRPAKGQRMGSMRNGCGDYYFILFGPDGVAIKGFAHEYEMACHGEPPKGVLDAFPASIEDFLTEPAFSMDDTSFCIWHLPDAEWSIGPVEFPEGDDPDGSEFLLGLLTGRPEDYQAYARDYFEVDVPLAAIASVYAHAPLTDQTLRALNGEVSLRDLMDELTEVGYPVAG